MAGARPGSTQNYQGAATARTWKHPASAGAACATEEGRVPGLVSLAEPGPSVDSDLHAHLVSACIWHLGSERHLASDCFKQKKEAERLVSEAPCVGPGLPATGPLRPWCAIRGGVGHAVAAQTGASTTQCREHMAKDVTEWGRKLLSTHLPGAQCSSG